MCKWGTHKEVLVTVPAHLSSTGNDKERLFKIDACIADIVEALNKGGVKTTQSCCGHGEQDGEIWLMDGRKLTIKKH